MEKTETRINNINRRDFVKSVGVGAAGISIGGLLEPANAAQAAVPDRPAPGKKPNVVIIFCDQLRNFALGCYGNKFVNTPNIDRLARNGFLFEQGISNSPVCTPARSNLMSGQYSRTCAGSRTNEMSAVPGDKNFGRDDRMKFKDPTIAEEFILEI
ncbi:MAG: sulfatase-like hydrolase/transferase, partial [Bacteroidetes bacterium]|nr:sulfatase-like hydrolase/transferase [Bacteroidota bacterium]